METDTTPRRLRRKQRFIVHQGRIVVDKDGLASGGTLDIKARNTKSPAVRPAPSKTGDPIYAPMKAEAYPYRLLTNRTIMLSSAGLLCIGDLYTLIDGIQWAKDELNAQLQAAPDATAPEYLRRVPQISQIISSLLKSEDIFECETAEAYIESRTVDNFRDIANTVAVAEARIFNALSLLADLERCTWFQDIKVYHEGVSLRSTFAIEGENINKAIDLKLKLVQSRLTRAEVRDYLENMISDLSTPRLAALRFQPHLDAQTDTEIPELPIPLPPDVTFVQAFIYQLRNQLHTPPSTPLKAHAAKLPKCLLCHGDADCDPKRAGHNAKPQLLIYTDKCCRSGPYHVVCMLSHLKTNGGSEAACPVCFDVLGKEYLMELMERRSLELRMT